MLEKTNFDNAIDAALKKAALKREISFTRNMKIGEKPGGLNLVANWCLTDSFNRNQSALLLTRFQDQTGSTEEKLTSLLVRLKVAMDNDFTIKRVWLVLGGHGWTKSYIHFLQEKLGDLIPDLYRRITLISHEDDLDSYDFSDF